jgi:outer membrane protein OmpA-like peptidoglycan-associated protein
MMNMRAVLLAIVALAVLQSGAPARAGYAADLAESRWQSVAGAAACHLVHTVPRLGTVVLTQYNNLDFAATVVTRRPPAAEREGRLYRLTPDWKGGGREALQTIRAKPGLNSVSLDSATARRIVRGLEAGDFVAMRFTQWGGGPLEAALSPVRFRPALRAHLRCLGRTDGDDRPVESGPAGAAAPAATTGTRPGNGADGAPEGLPAPAPVDVYFATASAQVDKTDLDAIHEVAERLAGGGYWSRIVVSGHADGTGGSAFNRALGLARAVEVRNRLVNLGVSGDRIEVRTRGEKAPRDDNGTEYGRARNRRVTIEAEH